MDSKVSSHVAAFAFKFCNELEKHKTTVCSPLSAETALALLALGCRDESLVEIMKAFDIPDIDALRSTFAFLTTTLSSIEGSTLNIANKVYIKKGGDLKPEIQKDAEEVFKSTLEQLDFREKKAAASVINKWVAQATKDKIQDIISADILDEYTSLVLVNAIYFQGTWKTTFKTAHTKRRKFHVNNTTTILVPLMYMWDTNFKYGVNTDLKAKFLQMYYEGFESSMVFVLPDEIEGLGEVMQKLASGHDLMADIEALEETKVDTIMIPRFKTEITLDLTELLPKLGIKSIFDKKAASIDMLTSNEKLHVSRAIQKAVIEVNEDGTEASVLTYGVPMSLCAGKPKPRFMANRPFLYLLLAHNIPVFIGTYEGKEFENTRVIRKRPATVPLEPSDSPPAKLSSNGEPLKSNIPLNN